MTRLENLICAIIKGGYFNGELYQSTMIEKVIECAREFETKIADCELADMGQDGPEWICYFCAEKNPHSFIVCGKCKEEKTWINPNE